MIIIIDYGMGNVGSVKNALSFLGVEASVSRDITDIKKSTHLILPGVGAFGDGMKKLEEFELVDVLYKEVIENKKPFLGICLGMQLLANIGEEGGLNKGLGWVSGRVRRFQIDEEKFRVPHIGWNDIYLRNDAPLFKNITSSVFYFVHSYFFVPEDKNIIAATCDYGEKFPAAIQKDNIFGVQFHPEKSQKSGLALLKNFINFS